MHRTRLVIAPFSVHPGNFCKSGCRVHGWRPYHRIELTWRGEKCQPVLPERVWEKVDVPDQTSRNTRWQKSLTLQLTEGDLRKPCKQIRILLRENQQWLHPPATAKHPPSCSRETRKNDAIWCNDILWYSMIYYDILYCRWFIGDSRCSLHLCRGQIICTSVRYCSIKD